MAFVSSNPNRPQSLEEIHSSVPIPPTWWRRLLAFSGPAFLVSVGYMDPGNWGTDIQAGSSFGHRLVWVLLMSNLMALLLQSLATRLGVVAGRDLAQACRESYPKSAAFALWVLCEVAIAATDLAEVIGTIIGLKLLFGLPYLGGLVVAAADTFILLAIQRRGVRLLELLTLILVAVVGGSFAVEFFLIDTDWAGVVRGFIPSLDPLDPTESLYVAIAMLGATVMPHNLYLHSALVQTRAFPQTPEGKKLACRFNLLDSAVALNGAFFINAAILVLAASSFTSEVKTLPQAYTLLRLVWGTALASSLFAVALLASGQSSTFTGTLAGQVVMEGFVRLRLRPWVRRLLTRSIAILPALLVISLAGNETVRDRQDTAAAVAASLASSDPLSLAAAAAAGNSVWAVPPVDKRLFELLVLSQAVLSFQLPFAIVPLIQFTSGRRWMGEFASRGWVKVLAWACAAVIVALNVVLIYQQIGDWATSPANHWWVYGVVVPLAVALAGFLAWITFYPLREGREEVRPAEAVAELPEVRYRTIGVAVEFDRHDRAVLAQAAEVARLHGAALVVVHVVEGVGVDLYGSESDAQESRSDRGRMAQLTEHLRQRGLEAQGVLGYGNPAEQLVRIAKEQGLDLLVLGTHGHRLLADLALGRTVSPVLHKLTIPVLVVPTRAADGGD